MNEKSPDGGPNRPKGPWKHLHLGLQFAVTVGLFAALGYWLDGRFGWSPWGTAVLSILGVAAGMYHFLKETL